AWFRQGVAGAVEVGLRWAEAEARWGDLEEAERLAREQVRLARRHGLRKLSVRAELLMAELAWRRSDLGKARSLFAVALERARNAEEGGAELWLDIGRAFADVGMASQAEAAFRTAVGCASTGRERAAAWSGLAAALRRQGRCGEAVEAGRRALRVAHWSDEQDLLPEILRDLAVYLAEAGHVLDARRTLALLERSGKPSGQSRRGARGA
ncbi:MAG: hypothetical protein QJR14_09185, partial [Bacillota bacterium]|nr:hypothetical protein [Bacillota bacterium]